MPRGEFDRSQRREQTREALLTAAARVYARAGVNGATLDDVAAEAGFTKGAVYGHFGSKENLLVALVDEHLSRQIAEQITMIDRGGIPWERPIAGSDLWIDELRADPDPFRLFVELWVHAQRDERLRQRLISGLAALREMFMGFGTDSTRDAGLADDPDAVAQFADVALGLSIGLAMLTLADPDTVAPSLLGVALSVFVQATQVNDDARARLAALAAELPLGPLPAEHAQ